MNIFDLSPTNPLKGNETKIFAYMEICSIFVEQNLYKPAINSSPNDHDAILNLNFECPFVKSVFSNVV